MINKETIEKCKEYPIKLLLSDRRQQRVGNKIRLSCPLHNEKTPSFYIFQDNGYKCFGCDNAGDVIDLVMKKSGCSFCEAIEYIKRCQSS